jgi:hypothetical protein
MTLLLGIDKMFKGEKNCTGLYDCSIPKKTVNWKILPWSLAIVTETFMYIT